MPALSDMCEPSHCAIQVGVAAVVGAKEVQAMVELEAGEGECRVGWRGVVQR